jgi:hypothetical protein
MTPCSPRFVFFLHGVDMMTAKVGLMQAAGARLKRDFGQ